MSATKGVRELCKSYENLLKPLNERSETRNAKMEFSDKQDEDLNCNKEKRKLTEKSVATDIEKKESGSKKMLWRTIPISKTKTCPLQTVRFLHNPIFKNVSEIFNATDPLAINHFHGKGCSLEILSYMKELESRYMKEVKDIFVVNYEFNNILMGVIVDWMIQVQFYLRLQQETLHLALGICYRYMSKQRIRVKHLQLAFIAGLWIASKFYERYPCEMKSLIALTDNAYTCNELMSMEHAILYSLRFDLAFPDVETFLYRCISYSGETSKEIDHLSHYLMDSVLPYPEYFKMPPSMLAAAAVYLSKKIINSNLKTHTFRIYEYTEEQITPAVQFFIRILETSESSDWQGGRKKYRSKSRYGCISEHPVLKTLRNFRV